MTSDIDAQAVKQQWLGLLLMLLLVGAALALFAIASHVAPYSELLVHGETLTIRTSETPAHSGDPVALQICISPSPRRRLSRDRPVRVPLSTDNIEGRFAVRHKEACKQPYLDECRKVAQAGIPVTHAWFGSTDAPCRDFVYYQGDSARESKVFAKTSEGSQHITISFK